MCLKSVRFQLEYYDAIRWRRSLALQSSPFKVWYGSLTLLIIVTGKWHILTTIFIAEMLTETRNPHYMRGGDLPKIVFPPRMAEDITEGWREDKMKLKQARELNNGRLAMVGVASFLAEYYNPGAVPILSGIDAF